MKFQNISAILYEEKMPYADGLLPRFNYQSLLRLLVLDQVKRTVLPSLTPRDILIRKLRQLYRRGFVKVTGTGAGRFGLTLEHQLGIPQNSSKAADFMGIELKTKRGTTLQTLFSRKPTDFTGVADKKTLVTQHGYLKNGRQQLYTSFNSGGDTLGFSLKVTGDKLVVVRKNAELLSYDAEALEAALLSKHTETAYIGVSSQGDACRFDTLLYCKWPSILWFLRLVRAGHIYLDFTLSLSSGRVRDHGFLSRIPRQKIADLYLSTAVVDLSK